MANILVASSNILCRALVRDPDRWRSHTGRTEESTGQPPDMRLPIGRGDALGYLGHHSSAASDRPSWWRLMSIVGIDHVLIAMPPGEEASARAFYVDVLQLEEKVKP